MTSSQTKPIRIAILGGTGFVGKNVREELESAGMTVGTFSRTTGCDLLNLPEAWAQIDRFRPDYLINCAALVGSINFVSDFAADVVDVNMRIILNAYKIAQKMHEAVVINPVANCAYPGVLGTYDEASLWNGPVHPSVLSYGATRRMMCVLAKCYHEQYGVRSVNLIVPNLYGPYDSTNPNKTHALNALVIKFVRAIKSNLPSVEVWGTGKPVREWLFVKDLARVMRRAIESGEVLLEPVNIGQNRGYSVHELVQTIRDLTGFGGTIEYNTAYQDGSLRRVMDAEYFETRFPDFHFTSLTEGIRETINYYSTILLPSDTTTPAVVAGGKAGQPSSIQ